MLHRLPVSAPAFSAPRLQATPASQWRLRLLLTVVALSSIASGIAVGLALTVLATRSDSVGVRRDGAWHLLVDAGTTSINPYLRAYLARTGQVPLVEAQGLTTIARRDDSGRRLDRRCTYRLTGPIPPALFWTIETADLDGLPFDTPARRQSFTSEDVLREAGGQFSIDVSSTVQPGNWLPLAGTGSFALILRIYDTTASSDPSHMGNRAFPIIEALRCA